MKIRHIIINVTLSVIMTGCMSKASKRQMYYDMKNYEIGLPFYSFETEGMRKKDISSTETEFIQDPLPPSGGGVAWLVNTSERGKYKHPTNGMVFDIEGFKKSWRYVGNSDACMMYIGWFEPW